MKRKRAFTLAEVLIALVLLGIVAVFTIPNILVSQAKSRDKALFLETIAALQSTVYSGNLNQSIGQSASLTAYLASQLNAIQTCSVNFQTEGCYTVMTPVAQNMGGFVLPNGVTVSDIASFPVTNCTNNPTAFVCYDGWAIDINGNQPPNAFGQDRLAMDIHWGGVAGVDSQGVFRKVSETWPENNLGTFADAAANIALWNSLYN